MQYKLKDMNEYHKDNIEQKNQTQEKTYCRISFLENQGKKREN